MPAAHLGASAGGSWARLCRSQPVQPASFLARMVSKIRSIGTWPMIVIIAMQVKRMSQDVRGRQIKPNRAAMDVMRTWGGFDASDARREVQGRAGRKANYESECCKGVTQASVWARPADVKHNGQHVLPIITHI